jgi:hypothetical protein
MPDPGVSATDDWGPEIWPDHYWSEGCCELDQAAHPLTPAESERLRQWLQTEAGLQAQLASRLAAFDRLLDLHAPDVILATQRELITKTKRRLLGMAGPDDRVNDPVDEMTERMAEGKTRGTMREPGPDDQDGTEWEQGEP